jgi:carotenoid 1,2-hydratase
LNFPPFDAPVPPGGYTWWYLDALSDDGRSGITVIALLGSVFSPYYALARRRKNPDPKHYSALNIALYGQGGKRWAMTERGRRQVQALPDTLRIGPSALHWDGEALWLTVDEITAPWPSRIRGRITLRPTSINTRQFALDTRERHRWWPIAPHARIEVDLERPARRWSGTAYLDSNAGDEPLEQGFRCWDWSRATLGGNGTAILYDVSRRDGTHHSLALILNPAGRVEAFEPPPPVTLPSTQIWRIARGTRGEDSARVVETLEDTPFYARSLVASRLLGVPVMAVHESLSLERFDTTWVKLLLPFRMPRRG